MISGLHVIRHQITALKRNDSGDWCGLAVFPQSEDTGISGLVDRNVFYKDYNEAKDIANENTVMTKSEAINVVLGNCRRRDRVPGKEK